jgi:hypothetical protein
LFKKKKKRRKNDRQRKKQGRKGEWEKREEIGRKGENGREERGRGGEEKISTKLDKQSSPSPHAGPWQGKQGHLSHSVREPWEQGSFSFTPCPWGVNSSALQLY